MSDRENIRLERALEEIANSFVLGPVNEDSIRGHVKALYGLDDDEVTVELDREAGTVNVMIQPRPEHIVIELVKKPL